MPIVLLFSTDYSITLFKTMFDFFVWRGRAWGCFHDSVNLHSSQIVYGKIGGQLVKIV